MRSKVVLHSDDAIGREAAHARVILSDGRVLKADVARCRGSAGRPLTDDDLSAKTRGQLQLVYSAGASERILAECWRIADYPRVDTLCGLLAEAK